MPPKRLKKQSIPQKEKKKNFLPLEKTLGHSYPGKVMAHDNGKFKCLICPSTVLQRKRIGKHLTGSMHLKNTPPIDLQELEDFKTNYTANKTLRLETEENAHYLEFLGFLLNENLSFLQISSIGAKLKELFEKKKLNFLKNKSFDRELLSKSVRAIGLELKAHYRRS